MTRLEFSLTRRINHDSINLISAANPRKKVHRLSVEGRTEQIQNWIVSHARTLHASPKIWPLAEVIEFVRNPRLDELWTLDSTAVDFKMFVDCVVWLNPSRVVAVGGSRQKKFSAGRRSALRGVQMWMDPRHSTLSSTSQIGTIKTQAFSSLDIPRLDSTSTHIFRQ